MPRSQYLHLDPIPLERKVAEDLEAALHPRGAHVTHDGRAGRPDIVVDMGRFAVIVEVAKRSGADAASEYPSLVDHRTLTERELGKPTHVLFTCLKTPARLVRLMNVENNRRQSEGLAGRFLFLNLEAMELVLRRLAETAAARYPNDRWAEWFDAWQQIGDDTVALDQLRHLVLAEDAELREQVEPLILRRAQVEQERLRKDIRKLEDTLRQSSVVKQDAQRALVYIVFVKLYEEKREAEGETNRFTETGFVEYRNGLSRGARRTYADRTLHYLIEEEIAVDPDVQAAGILDGVQISSRINDRFIEDKVLPVLDRYRFRGTHIDALGAVFEAIARRAEKDVRIGQFFTPEPIVRFAVEVTRPLPTEVVLDPASGTGRFLTLSMDRMVAHADEVPGVPREQVVRRIHTEQLLGTDSDAWIVTIAKMNMYIHGDGKSNIRHENGLFLADVSTFTRPRGRNGATTPIPPLEGTVDVCLTNPPLGAMSYRTYAEDLLRNQPDLYDSPDAWLRARLPLLPGEYREERQVRDADARIREWDDRMRAAIVAGDGRAERDARRWRDRAAETRAASQ